MGERNERGKFLPKARHVNHFGNVAIGDGTVQPDVAFDRSFYGCRT